MPSTAHCKLFSCVVSEIEGGDSGPIRLRHLLIVARALESCEEPLPSAAQRACKVVTGVRHKTYGAAARAIAGLSFTFSGNYLRALLVAGLDPSVEKAMLGDAEKILQHQSINEVSHDLIAPPPSPALASWSGWFSKLNWMWPR